MSIVEGSGIFKCTNESHKKEFQTTDIQKFNEHLLEKGHTLSGRAPCAVCDTEVTFEDLPTGKKPVCDKCKKELIA